MLFQMITLQKGQSLLEIAATLVSCLMRGQKQAASENSANLLHSPLVVFDFCSRRAEICRQKGFIIIHLFIIYYYSLIHCHCCSYRRGRKGKGSEPLEPTLKLLYNMLAKSASAFVFAGLRLVNSREP